MTRKQKYDYFKAFENQTDIALAEADLLIKTIQDFTTAEAVRDIMPDAHELEHKGDEINHATYTAIAVDFITPIDRDDILGISQSLDDIIDEIEDVIQLFYMMDIHFMHKDAIGMAALIKKSCESLKVAMKEFSNFKKSPLFKQSIVDVNSYEEDADELYAKLIRNLHTIDKDNPMRVLVWSRIFSKMEKCSDACEHVADTMGTVLLKNS
jgi:predicted phosphate transport protein (TIGR00153 family)